MYIIINMTESQNRCTSQYEDERQKQNVCKLYRYSG